MNRTSNGLSGFEVEQFNNFGKGRMSKEYHITILEAQFSRCSAEDRASQRNIVFQSFGHNVLLRAFKFCNFSISFDWMVKFRNDAHLQMLDCVMDRGFCQVLDICNV